MSAPSSEDKLERVAAQSDDLRAALYEQLRTLVPEAFVEGRLDADKLKALLGENGDAGAERYGLSWAGKRDAISMLQLPTRATLVPDRENSINFDEAHHAFIEGENLEVLKVLYRSYFGRVKMIYIDPPYNTGSDFIYPDDFADPLDHYLRITGQKNGEGDYLSSDIEHTGRFHSAWLSMMYPRLSYARQFLREDGFIFVSIDDHEVHNLRRLMDEIFGEENFLGCIVRATGQTVGQDARGFGQSFDYILAYSKSDQFYLSGVALSEKDVERFSEEDEHGAYHYWQMRKTGNNDRREDRPNLYYPVEAPDRSVVYPTGPGGYESRWRFGKATYERLVKEGFIIWKQTKRNGAVQWWPYVKYYLEDRTKRPSPLWTDIEGSKKASRDFRQLMGDKVFTNPKPVEAIMRLLTLATAANESDIVLDFFAGSASTAHAVIDQNLEDGGDRRVIVIQMADKISEKTPAHKNGLTTIADIARERIRRVLTSDLLNHSSPGFRSYRMAESCFRRWTGVGERDANVLSAQIEAFVDSLVPGWKPENVIWETALREGCSLTSRIEKIANTGTQNFWRVTDPEREQSFVICLDETVTLDAVRALKLRKDSVFICRDAALNDTLSANLALQCRLKVL